MSLKYTAKYKIEHITKPYTKTMLRSSLLFKVGQESSKRNNRQGESWVLDEKKR